LPPTAFVPSIFAAPNFAVSAFKAAIDFTTLASWALPALGINMEVAKKLTARTMKPATSVDLARGLAVAGAPIKLKVMGCMGSSGFMPKL
jgi:hypothetical protein